MPSPRTTDSTTGPRPRSKSAERKAKAAEAAEARRAAERAQHRRRLLARVGWVALAAVVLGGLFMLYRSGEQTSPAAGGSDQYPYQVGDPGPGEQAIGFTLPSNKGGRVSLQQVRGQTVLLYFHEGLGCQPCWDQIADIEKNMGRFKAAGVDRFYSVTSGPADLIAQKMRDDDLSSPALADSDLSVSKRYEMNQYGMMGGSTNGHSFLLVGPDGTIQWRADYGGEPNYTMYLPVDRLLADLKAGRQAAE